MLQRSMYKTSMLTFNLDTITLYSEKARLVLGKNDMNQ